MKLLMFQISSILISRFYTKPTTSSLGWNKFTCLGWNYFAYYTYYRFPIRRLQLPKTSLRSPGWHFLCGALIRKSGLTDISGVFFLGCTERDVQFLPRRRDNADDANTANNNNKNNQNLIFISDKTWTSLTSKHVIFTHARTRIIPTICTVNICNTKARRDKHWVESLSRTTDVITQLVKKISE